MYFWTNFWQSVVILRHCVCLSALVRQLSLRQKHLLKNRKKRHVLWFIPYIISQNFHLIYFLPIPTPVVSSSCTTQQLPICEWKGDTSSETRGFCILACCVYYSAVECAWRTALIALTCSHERTNTPDWSGQMIKAEPLKKKLESTFCSL